MGNWDNILTLVGSASFAGVEIVYINISNKLRVF